MVEPAMPTNHWHLDPAKFPKRIDLDLSEEVYEQLMAISQRTGRSVSEIAAEILDQYPPPREEVP